MPTPSALRARTLPLFKTVQHHQSRWCVALLIVVDLRAMQQEPEEPWHTVPTGRKGRKDPRERLPGDEAAPLEHRPRTPSCASLNSSCSTASRDIEIISGGCE